ncbi:hypothetical protein IVA96_12250 [Bradyrhizobium sp. 159]|uniref:hypothetical protein n=1 Tax=Bradyrhizobium sp. 159 TaxID=2782632 RepID=UPI001FF8540B|nr:hypothetical protein [Bradyrhizobium sp. 159]MCK1617404.1 hypothetical protein [Bradyrhizobium sp. 159]
MPARKMPRLETFSAADFHADFPVTAEGQEIKKQDGKPIASTEDADLAAPGALTTTKLGAKKISGQPDLPRWSCSVPISFSKGDWRPTS